jgi:hypothetical protein
VEETCCKECEVAGEVAGGAEGGMIGVEAGAALGASESWRRHWNDPSVLLIVLRIDSCKIRSRWDYLVARMLRENACKREKTRDFF